MDSTRRETFGRYYRKGAQYDSHTDTSEVTDKKHVIPDSSALIKAIISAKSRGEGVLSKLEVVVLLLLLKSQFFGFKRSELSAEGSCLLESKVVRSLLVLLVGLTCS